MSAVEQWVTAAQIQGGRAYQEDGFSVTLLNGDHADGDRLLLLLADGMGGHAGGAVASDTIIQTFWAGFSQAASTVADNLMAGVNTANEAISWKQQADPALAEMGSTLIAALALDDRLHWVSIGDSMLQLYRDGCLRRLNEDHSLRPALLDAVKTGELTMEEALNAPDSHQLRSAIIGEDIPLIDIGGCQLMADDLVLLASDGLETLSEEMLTAVLKTHANDAKGVAHVLLERVSAAEKAGQDNTTVIVYRVGGENHSLHSTLVEMEIDAEQPVLEEARQNTLIPVNGLGEDTETMETLGDRCNAMQYIL